jgi:hypothetical protein
MKKLKLNLNDLQNAEVLTRSYLKNVLGGVAVTTTKLQCGLHGCPLGCPTGCYCPIATTHCASNA